MRHQRSKASAAAQTVAVMVAVLTNACGGDGPPTMNPPPPPPPTRTVAKASPSGDGQTGVVQTALANPLRVLVTDGGAPEAGVSVTWGGSGTAASFSPSSSITDASGIAQTTWTLPRQAGAPSASATVSGAGGSPVSFTATANPGPPAALTKLDGDDQVGGVSSAADGPLRVTVADQYGNGLSGQTVTWSVTSGTATLGQGSTTTSAAGIASNALTFGGTTGPITVTATAAGLGTVTFNAVAGVLVNVQSVNTFSPVSVTVNAGDYVVWKWTTGAVSHTVTPDPPGTEPPSSGAPQNFPASHVHQFTTPGTYDYHCEVHGAPGVGMIGTVIVQ